MKSISLLHGLVDNSYGHLRVFWVLRSDLGSSWILSLWKIYPVCRTIYIPLHCTWQRPNAMIISSILCPMNPTSSLKRSFTQKWRSLSAPLHYPQDFRKLPQCICQRLGTVLLMQKLHEWDSQGCDPPCQSMQQLKFTKGQMSLLIIMGFSHNAPALRAAGRFLERAHLATHFDIY